MAIKLGSKVKDSITGFSGIATARAEYLYGCIQIQITPDKLKDETTIDSVWFDEQRVEVIEEGEPQVSKASSAKTGGPQRVPTSRSVPKG
jgi:hypothetical protein